MKRNMALVLLFLSLLTFSINFSRADIPQNWTRIDHEGLFKQTDIYNKPLKLSVSVLKSDLYAQAENGFYKFNTSSFDWEKQTISPDDLNPYKKFADLSQFPAGTTVEPILVFNKKLYAVVYPQDSTTFEIWRSPDLGKRKMVWNKVVSDGFGESFNHKLGLMIEYKKKLVVVTTNTRTDPSASFGDNRYFGPGIQVWESPYGDAETWYQINKDGFGAESTDISTGNKFRTNQDFGSGAVYNGNLYIGTLSHFGGQVWEYNGTGLTGWKNVTPDTMMTWGGPSRAYSMVVYNNYLYLGEGYPTGNIVKYDGTNWQVAVSGGGGYFGDPFAVTNSGITSLAVANGKLYAATLKQPYSSTIVYPFAQVWGYPYPYKNVTASYAYITNTGNNTVSVIDTATNNVKDTLNYVGSNPIGVAVSPDRKKVYVANSDLWNDKYTYDYVSVIDAATNAVTNMVQVGKLPWGIAVTPDGKWVYVANGGDNTVSVIDTTNNSVTATVNVGKQPFGVAVNPDGTNVYVTNFDDDTVSVIDTAKNTVIATVNVGDGPYGVAVNPNGEQVFVTNFGINTVSLINTTNNIVTATKVVGNYPSGIAVNPDGTKVYVVNSEYNYNKGSVSIFDIATNNVSTVKVGKTPYGVAVTPDGKYVYIANSEDNTVSVIDAKTNNVTKTVNVGITPYAFGQFIVPA